ncbi:MAG: hypothetical protein GX069_06550 [Tissierellia bacterium]|nr:hypothetical protein [Tissierellia bacterium]
MKKNIALIIILSIFLTSCTGQNEKNMKVDKKEVAPESLSKVFQGIDELLSKVDSIMETAELKDSEFQILKAQEEKKEEKSKEEKPSSGGGQGSQGQGEQGQGQGQESQQGGESQEKQEEDKMTKDHELFLKWREVDKKLEEIHTSWNDYEVESMDKGNNQQKSEELKNNLNDFTIAVANREINDIYKAGSRLYNSLAAYFDLYKDEITGDLSRIKYSVYSAFLQAQEGNIEEANKVLSQTEEYTSRVRKELKEDKIKNLEKLSLSIQDMKLALKEKNMELLKIKLDVIIENIRALRD